MLEEVARRGVAASRTSLFLGDHENRSDEDY
jgi:hypothetical protein